MYSLIYDESEVKNFFDKVLPPLLDTEAYFMSLSCRKKYLKDSEYNLKGSSEMFERRIVPQRDWVRFLSTLRKYEANEGAYTDSDGTPYPMDSLIVYLNFNPCDVMLAYVEFMKVTSENTVNMILGKGSSVEWFKGISHKWMTCLHHARGTKHYIDVDIDYKNGHKHTNRGLAVLNGITDELREQGTKFLVITTHSGYHILMRKETLAFDYMRELYKPVLEMNLDILDDIMANSQGMIPCPGTLQAGYPVRVMYDISDW